MKMEQLSFSYNLILFVLLFMIEFAAALWYQKASKSWSAHLLNQLSFYLGLLLLLLENFLSIVIESENMILQMFYDMLFWFVIPPLILIGLEKYLHRLFWYYRFRHLLLFLIKPRTTKILFFSFLFMYFMTDLPIFLTIVLKLLITMTSYLLWWSLIISSVFIQPQQNEKEKILTLFVNMVIITFILYLFYLTNQSTFKEMRQISLIHVDQQIDLLLGILIFLGGFHVVSLTFIAYFFVKWGKREHVIDPINVAGWLGKSPKRG
ncbi:cytochrome c oxidase assembly protein [Aeribacillus alveayuensis]|uniref:Cytochrome c oxidase assembly factor CtaG n=1 Tax=Aeribacillus alveayuensis TaxID=279215 RepID=A0ABT9VM44_9BACI|nr:cytochrome c oxidase assembly factor CtaG [Bacillus alveayuensis]